MIDWMLILLWIYHKPFYNLYRSINKAVKCERDTCMYNDDNDKECDKCAMDAQDTITTTSHMILENMHLGEAVKKCSG